jgi:hypothetical protein
MKGLRSRVVRLAHERADLRPLLVPLLKKAVPYGPKRLLNQALLGTNLGTICIDPLDEDLYEWAVNPQRHGFVWTGFDLVGVESYSYDDAVDTNIPVSIRVTTTAKQPVRGLQRYLSPTIKRDCTREVFPWFGTDEAAKVLASYLSTFGHEQPARTFPADKVEQLFDWLDQREELPDVFVTYRLRNVRDVSFEGTAQGSALVFTGSCVMELEYEAEEGDTSPF